MALPQEFLMDLKARNDIESVLSPYVALKRRGSNLVGLCPFHNEKTPSFTVYPENGSYYCFGCGQGGDIITFMMRIENLDYIHMGSDVVTIDFDGELSWEQLLEIEREANRAVAANYKVTATFPAGDVLKTLEYRSKLELTENVRIVEIENTDICACCAPHVSSTAEVGTVRILTAERRRRGGDGVRITMLCGLDAFEHEVIIDANNAEVSTLLSAKRTETAAAVRRLLGENEKLKARAAELSRELARIKAEAIEPTEGNINA